MIKDRLILHRGYKGKYSENSVLAFQRALKEGYAFETDIRTSKNGIPFLIHDDTTKRLFGVPGRIDEKNSDELNFLYSFEELCKSAKDYNSEIFVHIKELKDFNVTAKIVRKNKLENNINFFACDDISVKLLRRIKKYFPELKVGLHLPEDSPYKNSRYFSAADFIWADEITKENIEPKLVEMAHGLNKPFYAISPELIPESIFNKNIEERWKELLEMGVDGVCTDKPEKFLKFSGNLA